MKEWFRQRADALAVFTVTFIVSFAVYFCTLAPTVTFEDSGELIAAAYHLGVPHPPGYPLYTFTGRLFCMLPLEPAAYRMNVMSAWFGAMAAGVLACSAFLVLMDIRNRKPSKINENDISGRWKILLSVSTGLVFAFAFETWEQTVITEVYSLHHFLLALMLMTVILWNQPDRRKDVWFALFMYLSGLSLGNHHLTLAVLPAFYFLFWFTDRKFLLNVRRIMSGVALLIAGLSVYVYLPVASSRDPVLDWGNPENWLNFKNTILRMQYQVGEPHTWPRWTAQLYHYGELLMKQWPVYFLALAVIGLYGLNRFSGKWLLFGVLYISGSVFLTVYATNFHVRDPNPVIADENRHLVSVFYTASYLFIALLMGVGGYQILLWIRNLRARIITGFLVALVPVMIVISNINRVSMRDYRFAAQYVSNLFQSAEPHSLILTNYDPHYFSTFYYRYVEGLRPDLVILDIKLLETSWYLDRMERMHPDIAASVRKPFSHYRDLVRQYEKGMKVNPMEYASAQETFLNAVINEMKKQKRRVYLTFDPPEKIGASYFAVSAGSAIELLAGTDEMVPADLSRMDVDDYLDDRIPKDRMAQFFKTYYGRLILARAMIEESMNNYGRAAVWYQKAHDFLKSDARYAPSIRDGLKRTEKYSQGMKP